MRKNRRPKDRAPATSVARVERASPTTLVLFDIDGTLVLTGGAGGRAMPLAFQELFAVDDAFRGIPMPGRTDAAILSDAATTHRISSDSPTLARFPEIYLRHLASELQKPGPRKGVMPGVRGLLDALTARHDVFLSLLTGNFARGAVEARIFRSLALFFRRRVR